MFENRRKKDANEENAREDTMGTNVYSSKDNESLHKSLNGEFILYQILLQRILDEKTFLKSNESSLLKYFQPEDEIDANLMKEFDEFYKSSQAIHWYTRECCIYKILNKAFLMGNIDDLVP
ncbi:unnamed protein product, partial [Adineta ricciae]